MSTKADCFAGEKRLNSSKNWPEIGFSLEKTMDGSPTLRRHQPSRPDFENGQSMHHSGGAWEETVYIYKPVTDWVRALNVPRARFLSVGLGLGYVELLIARECLNENIELRSFEIVPELGEYFQRWILNEALHPEVQATYDLAAQFVFGGDSELESKAKLFLAQLRAQGHWRIDGALEEPRVPEPLYHGIMYDAFSRAVSPELWQPEFMIQFLRQWAAPQVCFSSFSCTGDLKRSLKAEGFLLEVRLGFKSKRNCTLAVRAGTIGPLTPGPTSQAL
jgi:tRNA U34 5-methylaminomethyl-2-thiouridine-forming methyltransferase MnmC